MAIEVFVAGHVGRDVARRGDVVLAAIALGAPAVEIVAAGDLERSRAAGSEHGGLARRHSECLYGRHHFGLAEVDGDARRTGFRLRADAIASGLPEHHRPGRRCDFDEVVMIDLAHAHVERTARKPQLYAIVVEMEHVEAREWCDARGGRPDVQLAVTVAVGPQAVAAGERAIEHRLHPLIGGVGRCERHRARRVIEPADAAGGVGVSGRRARGERQCQQASEEVPHERLTRSKAARHENGMPYTCRNPV
jgi:hypothetical protein